jgi:hypothetical protein
MGTMLITAIVIACLAQCPAEVDVLPTTPDGLSGTSIAIDGDIAVIGCPIGTGNGWASGMAIVYRLVDNVWLREAELIANDGAIGDMMGVSVDVSNGRVIAGAWFNNHAGTNSGAAYMFEQVDGKWVQTAKLIASDAAPQDTFGRRVAINDDVCIVSAPLDDDNGESSGSVYVFQYDGDWFQLQKINTKAGLPSDQFGLGLAMDGERIVVGSPWYDEGRGRAHVFDRGDVMFFESEVLIDPNGASMDNFSFGLDVDGDTIAIGSYLDDDVAEDSGSLFVFEKEKAQWILQQQIVPSGKLVEGEEFAVSVAIDNEILLVGSRFAVVDGVLGGKVTVFENWQEHSIITSPVPAIEAEFGWAVAVEGDNGAIGEPWIEPDGEAHFFTGFIGYCNCVGDLDGDGFVGVTDLLQLLGVWGACKNCQEDFDGNGFVDVSDILELINSWGGCH